jgi:hypothetical protein
MVGAAECEERVSISSIYNELARNARRTGEARSTTLTKGARLTVRAGAGYTVLTISRKGKRVGDGEIIVFTRECGVPAHAARNPREGQLTIVHENETWWYLSYRWNSTE